MSGAVVAVVVDEKLEILHVAEEARGLDHLQTLLHGRFPRHLHQKPHEVSYVIGLAYSHTPMTQNTALLCKCLAGTCGSTIISTVAAWIIPMDRRV